MLKFFQLFKWPTEEPVANPQREQPDGYLREWEGKVAQLGMFVSDARRAKSILEASETAKSQSIKDISRALKASAFVISTTSSLLTEYHRLLMEMRKNGQTEASRYMNTLITYIHSPQLDAAQAPPSRQEIETRIIKNIGILIEGNAIDLTQLRSERYGDICQPAHYQAITYIEGVLFHHNIGVSTCDDSESSPIKRDDQKSSSLMRIEYQLMGDFQLLGAIVLSIEASKSIKSDYGDSLTRYLRNGTGENVTIPNIQEIERLMVEQTTTLEQAKVDVSLLQASIQGMQKKIEYYQHSIQIYAKKHPRVLELIKRREALVRAWKGAIYTLELYSEKMLILSKEPQQESIRIQLDDLKASVAIKQQSMESLQQQIADIDRRYTLLVMPFEEQFPEDQRLTRRVSI